MTVINIKGTIIPNDEKYWYDWLGMDATCPNDIHLPELAEPVTVVINSGGGDVYAGSEIYTKLRAYEGQVTVQIVGVAASAASVIAMAGDRVEISPTAQLMIHNVSAGAYGDDRTFAQMASTLSGFNKSIANSYVAKTGKPMEDLLELMAKETWFDAETAVEQGFCDKVMFAEEAPKLVASSSPVLPQKLLDYLQGVQSDLHRLTHELATLKNQAPQAVETGTAEGDDDVEGEAKPLTFANFVF